LGSDCDCCLFIDADIQFNVDDIVRLLEKGASGEYDVIGGIYPKKYLHWNRITPQNGMAAALDYVVAPMNEEDVVTDINEPVPAQFVGTGLMLIQRRVFELMRERWPDDWYIANGTKYHKFFDCIVKNKVYLSEDYFFCDKWRELGGTVYAAYWTRSVHWGIFGYNGDIQSCTNK
jgi:hypothetical protein